MRAIPTPLLRYLSGLAPCPTSAPATDAALLGRFVSRGDEAAFAVLVARHGPMVLRVCRRVLGTAQDAEDAFQATFLVLARKAGAIRRRHHLAAWLHGAAYRLALKARAARARRRRGEASALIPEPPDPQPDPLTRMTARELLTALDEELGRLPEVYRLPLVLCCLEGRTQDEAARLLGWTPGSVKGRLERGRARLHARLARRGLALSAALLALEALDGPATAGIPAAWLTSATQAALRFAAGVRDASDAGSQAIPLAEGVLKAMLVSKIKNIAAVLLLVIVATAGTGSFLFRSAAEAGVGGPPVAAPTSPPAARANQPDEKKKPPSDQELLQGTWVAVAAEANGKAQPDTVKQDFRLRIEGNRFTMGQELALHFPQGMFTLDPTTKPKAIDLTETHGMPKEEPVLVPGIYELDGATLRVCMSHAGGKRPRDFTTAPGSDREMYLFERPGAAKPQEEPGKKNVEADMDKLQGTWAAVSREADGKADPAAVQEGLRLTVEGNRFTLRPERALHFPNGTFTLDAGKQPRAIDFTQTHGLPREEPQLIPGIYEFDGATLKICRAISGGTRPTDFTTKPGSGRELLVFRRPAAGGAKQDAPVPDAWSEPVKGLSGRLRVAWLRQGDTLRPEVTAELKNVEPAKSLAVSNRFRLEVRVADESGKEVKGEPRITDATGIVPEQWGVVPAGAYLGYPADLRCTGSEVPAQWFAPGKPVVLALAGEQWTLPPGRYVVSARLTAGETKTPPPPAATRWEGTLALPPVEVVVPGERAAKPGRPEQGKTAPADEQERAKAIEVPHKLSVLKRYLPFQGQWRVVSMEDAKGQTSDLLEILVTVRGMGFELSGPGVSKDLPMPLEFRVPATKKENPYRALQEGGMKNLGDIVDVENQIEVFWFVGIYKLSDDELHLALKYCGQGVEGAAARNFRPPSSFHQKLMDGETRITLKRQVSLDNLPDLQAATHRVDPYIRAAAMLQDMGKDKATDALSKLARGHEHGNQVIVLCRMLFTPKANGKFRRPALGAALFLGGTGDADWPLEPIELVDGVPFLITRGYDIGGQAEPAEAYLKYCLRDCDWNSVRFKPKGEQEKQKALKKLLASPKWKARLDDAEKAFLSSQIK